MLILEIYFLFYPEIAGKIWRPSKIPVFMHSHSTLSLNAGNDFKKVNIFTFILYIVILIPLKMFILKLKVIFKLTLNVF